MNIHDDEPYSLYLDEIPEKLALSRLDDFARFIVSNESIDETIFTEDILEEFQDRIESGAAPYLCHVFTEVLEDHGFYVSDAVRRILTPEGESETHYAWYNFSNIEKRRNKIYYLIEKINELSEQSINL